MASTKGNLEDFLSGRYGEHPTTVIELEGTSDTDNPSPFIVVKHGDYAVVINPLALGTHLCIDVHPFVKGEDATAGAFGMTNGKRVSLPETGTKSHGWHSSGLVAVLVGEQE